MTALHFDAVTIRLGRRDILSAASFSVREGEFVGMLGANGAGKTTLMRAALGLVPVAAGAVSVFDLPVTRGNPAIGYMPQNRAAIAGLRLTGWDVVASAATGRRFGFTRLDKAVRREIDWALDEVGARDLARRSISELSGGERQRVLLSQALLGRPRLLLLDEPLISLDPAHQKSVVEIARRICDDLKVAIVFSAHELNPLVNAIDRVLYLGAGAAVHRPGRGGRDRPGAVAALRSGDRGGAGQGPLFRHGGRRRGRARGPPPRPCARAGPRAMLEYDFMRTAFAASGVAAVLAGTVGFFLVLRGQTFAGHALSHVGFTGATGALLFGLSPLAGLVGFTLVAGIGMGLFGEKLAERDVAIGMMLSLALGLGLLFLHFYTAAATQAAALLFGNVLGVDSSALMTLVALAASSLAALAAIGRPLVFASIQPELAEARGVPLRFVASAFLAIVAVAVAECAQIVGVLLVFTLMVGPAAAAMNLTRRLPLAIALSATLALAEAWGGLTLAYYTDWPTSFWITALSGVVFFGATARRLVD